ncbi:ATP-dependent helicase [Subtercola boreus]|uniref:DNA 3'-5' helicase n=1 Tax=Subtercola boreus TaxID=120213 RepID=A0A3E0WAU4_9MICO|nr:ATP-dependent helicase [Subtercola boreus]RFA20071.1 ATP-dependent DNA helicase [Subtercola boreus]RFA20201.1 ATP-dependent DNA helicase [Subtercola boreus]RFA26422.1 ATP-dependent DNA helicase [Subtercola boreus]
MTNDSDERSLPATGVDALLSGLDDEQRVVAKTLLGPVVVLAGAGTGKTRAITHRIAYGVATGVFPPGKVMALTFTARSAAELRSRLRPLGAGGVSARTFHSAALAQLNFFWPQVVGGDVPRLLEGKARLIGQVAETLRLRVDTATLRDLAAEIEWRKISNLSIEAYGLAARSSRTLPGTLSVEQVLDLQTGYERIKDERKQLDFEDVLLATAGMIESEPSVAMQVREQYRFFVVDEYQDVSPLQHHLLSLWVGDRRDLCVVGDASQTIYSFAGAQSAFLLSFASAYENSTVVRLEQNYRSTPAVVDTANRLMRGRTGALNLRASADQLGRGPEPSVTGHSSEASEARAVAAAAARLIVEGTKPEDIAILYRMNAQAAALEGALAEAGVTYQIRGSQRFFDLPEVKQAVMSLRAASVSISGEPLFKSVSDVLRSLGWSQSPPEGRGAVRDRWESLNAIMSLAEQQPARTSFRTFTDELLERQAGQHEPTISAVTLATLHSAKGLEWPTVFIIGLSEGLVPISYATTLDQVDEERRLLYVGITRARQRLLLSWAETGASRSQVRSASRFLAELGTRTADARPAG